MPYSFVAIEESKSRAIHWSLGFLLFLYMAGALLIVGIVKYYLIVSWTPSEIIMGMRPSFWSLFDASTVGWTLAGALLVSGCHWVMATHAMIDHTLQYMAGRPADPSRDDERMFCNIVEEASAATGGKYNIEPVVIPTAAMNAFALQDFQGRSVIGITEGLLKKLNRAQIEAVIGHEAGHIASGDCLETTVTMVLFKAFDTVCDVSRRLLFFSGDSRDSRGSRRGGNQLAILFLIVFLLALALKVIGYLGSLFISRQREYRADALSVRMTRNPLALAEALAIISNRWRGSGTPGESFDAIYILSPRQNALDDRENLVADLFSTHPPVQKRIAVLLNMANANEKDLDKALAAMEQRDDVSSPAEPPSPVAAPQPISLAGASRVAAKGHCPRCRTPLIPALYEGFDVRNCAACGGLLVSESNVLHIVDKREAIFDQRIRDLARLMRAQVKPLQSNPFDRIYDEKSIACPGCGDQEKKMTRRFVSPRYPVEIDKCKTCGSVWFDKDELDVLQCLYETDHPLPAA